MNQPGDPGHKGASTPAVADPSPLDRSAELVEQDDLEDEYKLILARLIKDPAKRRAVTQVMIGVITAMIEGRIAKPTGSPHAEQPPKSE